MDVFPNGSVLTVYLKQHLSLPADQDARTARPLTRYSQTAKKVSALGDPQVQRVFCLYLCQLLPSSGSQCARGWLRGRKLTHLLPGFSWSRSLRTDLPSMSGGASSPAMSRMVGARSMFRTICGTLQRDRWSRPRPSTSGGGHQGCFLHPRAPWPSLLLSLSSGPRGMLAASGRCLSGQQPGPRERRTVSHRAGETPAPLNSGHTARQTVA